MSSDNPQPATLAAGPIGRATAAGLAILIVALLYLAWIAPTLYLADDAYFYLCIGRNIAAGLGSTFAGVGHTNGYHPLWQWCCAGIYLVVGDSDLLALRVAVIANVLMVAASLWLVWRLAARCAPPKYAPLAPVVLALVVTRDTFLLETWLYTLLWLCLLTRMARPGFGRRPAGALHHALTGVLCGAVVLARLDSAILIAVYFLATALERTRAIGARGAIRAALIEGAVVAAMLAPYAIGNYVVFGHVATISSMLKTSFPQPTLVGITDTLFVALTAPAVVLAVLFLRKPVIWLRGAPDDDGIRRALRIACIGAMLRIVAIYFFCNWAPWLASYWIDGAIVTALLLPAAAASLLNVNAGGAAKTAVAALYLAPLLWIAGHLAFGISRGAALLEEDRALGRWYAERFEPDAVIFQRDRAGIPAFWSRRRILDGGGLMNDIEFQHAVRDGRIIDYLSRHGARYAVWVNNDVLRADGNARAGEYRVAWYPVRTALYHRDLEFPVKKEWDVGRFAYILNPHRPTRTTPLTFEFCAWRLPEGWSAWAAHMSASDKRPG